MNAIFVIKCLIFDFYWPVNDNGSRSVPDSAFGHVFANEAGDLWVVGHRDHLAGWVHQQKLLFHSVVSFRVRSVWLLSLWLRATSRVTALVKPSALRSWRPWEPETNQFIAFVNIRWWHEYYAHFPLSLFLVSIFLANNPNLKVEIQNQYLYFSLALTKFCYFMVSGAL